MAQTPFIRQVLVAAILCATSIPVRGASLDMSLVAHLSLLNPPAGVNVSTFGWPFVPEAPYGQYQWDCCGFFTQTLTEGWTFTPDSVQAEIYVEGHQEGSVLGHPWHLGGTGSVNTTPRLVVQNTNDYAVEIPLEWDVSFHGYVAGNSSDNGGNVGYSGLVVLLRYGLPVPGVDPLLDQSEACTSGCVLSFNTAPSGTQYFTLQPGSVTRFALKANVHGYAQEAPEPAAVALMGLGLALLAGWSRVRRR